LDSRYKISYEIETGIAELVIKSVISSDEISYKCIASNKHGTAKSICSLAVKKSKVFLFLISMFL
jgi:hypothetical protein